MLCVSQKKSFESRSWDETLCVEDVARVSKQRMKPDPVVVTDCSNSDDSFTSSSFCFVGLEKIDHLDFIPVTHTRGVGSPDEEDRGGGSITTFQVVYFGLK